MLCCVQDAVCCMERDGEMCEVMVCGEDKQSLNLVVHPVLY